MKSKLVLAAFLIAGVLVGAGGLALLQSKSASAAACSSRVANAQSYQVMIMNNKPDNAHVQAKLCDSITFINMDNVSREIAFGPHERHMAYDGVLAKFLSPGQSFTITLNQAGSFHWHDHIHDEVEGYFTVTK